jgi:hypothetical protein
VEQAERRGASYICTVEEYMAARRNNIGSDPSFAFLEISLGVDLPHEVMEHPAIVALNRDTTDMIVLANVCSFPLILFGLGRLILVAQDMCSYKKEVLSNDADYNAVTVIMVNNKTDVAGGIQWISDTHDDIVEHFLAVRDDVLNHRNGVPSWGPDIDAQVEKYIDGLGENYLRPFRAHFKFLIPFHPLLGQWIRGHDEWNFGSGRYFGDAGLEIQKSRTVVIA